MDLFTAIRERRSCRSFLPEPVSEEDIQKILEAASWAPSPLNAQPWEFIVVSNDELKQKLFFEGDQRRKWAFEKSGWKWMDAYRVDFIRSAPCIIAVIGDPKKSGADTLFEEGGGVAYQHACAAAIQNMNLAAHALGYGTLWFTLFDRGQIREILGVDAAKDPLALILLGKPDGPPQKMVRKDVMQKTKFLR